MLMIAKSYSSVNAIVRYYRIINTNTEQLPVFAKKRRSFQLKEAFVDDIFSFGSNEFIKYRQQDVNFWLKSS